MQGLGYLNRYFYKYKASLLVGFLFVACSNIFGILSAQIIRFCVNLIKEYIEIYSLFINTSSALEIISKIIMLTLAGFAIIYFTFQLIKGGFLFLMRQTIIVTSRKIEFDLKHEIFRHFQSLPLEFFKKNQTGDLMTRITEDVTRVRMYAGPAIMYTMNLITLFIITITIMLMVNVELSIFALLPLPFLSVLIYRVSTKMYAKGEVIQSILSNLTNISQETYSGIRILKSYGRILRFQKMFANEASDFRTKSLDLAKVESLFFPLVVLLIGLSTILTIFIGGQQVINGEITYGNIVEFVYYINLLTWPVTAVGWIASLVQRAKVSQDRINQFLLTPAQDMRPQGATSSIDGSISIKDLHFHYPETGIHALRGLNMEIPQGKTVAVVGRTGSGKTTIVNLLLQFYENFEGSIRVNEKNLRDYSIKAYREQIGYVSQDVLLFSDTISNNIAFGHDTHIDQKIIEKYADLALLKEDLERMPDGLQTKIGERGIALSGGQKQRITIARAMIRQPKLLILDNCLSAVDAKTEQRIFANLKKENQKTTTILITHKVLSLDQIDIIYYLESGLVKECGTFEQLLKQKGSFHNLYQKQKLEENNT